MPMIRLKIAEMLTPVSVRRVVRNADRLRPVVALITRLGNIGLPVLLLVLSS